MNKKKLFAMLALVIVVAIMGVGTLAYFTTSVVTHNVITTSEIDISIQEVGPEGSTTLPDGGFSVSGVMPDTTVTKEVKVKNEAAQTTWLRAELVCTIEDADVAKPDTSLIEYVYPKNSDWVEKDGFYYYKKPLKAGENTSLLIEAVKISPEMGNAYQNCTVKVAVKAYAVQYANNGETVMEAAGWPET